MAFNSENYCRTLVEYMQTVLDDYRLPDDVKAEKIASYADDLTDTASDWMLASRKAKAES